MDNINFSEQIKDKITKLPDKPGVYLMRDVSGTVIYVGKAKVLKNRVRQYFRNYNKHAPKIKLMISKIDDFEYIMTDTEMEALILEASLIKKHWPRYNTLLKDDKQYPYIKITKEKYPRIIKVRKLSKDRAKYYGPFTSGYAVKNIIEILHELYPIRRCNLKLTGKKVIQRPCLNYYIHRCKAPCQGYIEEAKYNEYIYEAQKLIDGKEKQLIKMLKEKMYSASSELKFEEAAKYRDRIESLKVLLIDQKVVSTKEQDYDIIGVAKYMQDACVEVFFIRGGKILGKEYFILADVEDENEGNLINAFIKQFYGEMTYVPKTIYVQNEFEERELFEKWLSETHNIKVQFLVPKKGEKYHLMQMVKKNAFDQVFKHGEAYKKKLKKSVGAMEKIAEILKLEEKLDRVEAYDISNTQGQNSVGSMVVFVNGVKKPSDYRRFKIKNVSGPDDYSSMKEILLRRFSHGLEDRENKIGGSFASFPKLLLIDGGKGHVEVAKEALRILNIKLPVCGMVKDDRHRTRALIYENKEYDIKVFPDVFRLITQIQDEAHRFAITYHRNLRSNKIFKSELEEIKGIGPTRRKALLLALGDIQTIKTTKIEVLEQVSGMNRKAAENIYYHYHKNSNK